jgi:hypothetical protein
VPRISIIVPRKSGIKVETASLSYAQNYVTTADTTFSSAGHFWTIHCMRLPKRMAEPRWLPFGSYELVAALLRAMYGAKNQEEYRLRQEALLQTMEADRLVALAAKASGRPTYRER